MNTRTPLAAALLLAASTATAQPLAPAPTPNGGLFAGGVYNPMADPAGAFGAIQAIPPDVKWARADCQRIPSKTALQQRMEDQKKLTPNEAIVDMGDGESFGIIFTDDKGKKTISIDNGMSCGMPRALTDAEQSKFAVQIAKGDAQKVDAAQMDKSINGDKNGMKINADNTSPNVAAKDPPPTPAGAPDNTPSSGYQDGANMMRGLGGDSSGGDSSGGDASGGGMAGGDAGGTSGGATGAIGSGGTAGKSGGEGGKKKAIAYSGVKARQEAEAKQGYEFLAVGAAAKGSEGIGAGVRAAFNEGANASRPNVDDTYGDGKQLGKTQAAANSGTTAP